MEFLLTDKELIDITGYKLHRWQQRWLKDNGINFTVNKFGRPNVVRAVFLQRSGIKTKKEPTPDFEALEALNGKH